MPTALTKTEYPWYRCKAGESFFVPALDTARTVVDGMHAGRRQLGNKAPIRYRVGAHKGMLGVLFTVRPQAVSSLPE